jgi:hypothetical protein
LYLENLVLLAMPELLQGFAEKVKEPAGTEPGPTKTIAPMNDSSIFTSFTPACKVKLM